MAHLNLCTLFAATLPAVCDVRTLIYIMAAEIALSAHLQMNVYQGNWMPSTSTTSRKLKYIAWNKIVHYSVTRYKPPPPYPRQSMCIALRDDSCLTEDKVLVEAFTNTCAFAPLAVFRE